MSDFGLDLRAVEDMIDEEEADEERPSGRVILEILDGTTEPQEYIELVGAGNVLVLEIDGNLTELAAGFAPDIRDAGGRLVHFRSFLIVSPPGIEIDTERLQSSE